MLYPFLSHLSLSTHFCLASVLTLNFLTWQNNISLKHLTLIFTDWEYIEKIKWDLKKTKMKTYNKHWCSSKGYNITQHYTILCLCCKIVLFCDLPVEAD